MTDYGVDPSWVLNGITFVAGFMIWNQAKDIKASLQSLSDSIKEMGKMINQHEKQIALIEKDLERKK